MRNLRKRKSWKTKNKWEWLRKNLRKEINVKMSKKGLFSKAVINTQAGKVHV